MVVALTALFVALGGSAYALVITGKSIRNNTVRNVDIRNHTLLARDHKRDSLGGETINEFRLGTVPGAAVAEGASHYAVVTRTESSPAAGASAWPQPRGPAWGATR